MSRICVKNIGKNCTDKQLKDLFSSKGEVTDVKVINSKDGKSRRFAFVGFRTDLQASEAQKHFNSTFIGQSKMVIEMAKKYSDQSLIDAKAKHTSKRKPGKTGASQENSDTEDDKADTKVIVKQKAKESAAPSAIDTSTAAGRKKAEFLEMMKSRRNTNKWANDDIAGTGTSVEQLPFKTENKGKVSGDGPSGEQDSVEDSSEDDDDSEDDNYVNEAPEIRPEGMTDLEYLRSKMKKTAHHSDSSSSSSGSDSDDSMDESDNDDDKVKEKDGAEDKKAEVSDDMDVDVGAGLDAEMEDYEDNSRLFVKNLPFTCTEEELTALFSPFGTISELHLPLNEEKRGKGYGFVQFLLPEHADAALQGLCGEAFQGRPLYIVKAQKPREKDTAAMIAAAAAGNKGKLSSFQLKKEEERRKFLNKKDGWSASFVRSDTVVDSLAEK
jgi:multiple RNA-binding domain-containing protein 1